jgi:hypothetical protein
MEKSWNIYTIDEVKFCGCRHKKFTLRAVTNKYDDEKDEDHPNNREEYDTWEINEMTYACIAEEYKNDPGCAISPRMTVTVMKRGMNGNGLVKVKRV